ncbi:uncharacterized protein LOC112350152 [Selaginella moellendorffii]|uniref:uncharacterized protein LOC112350152 n=1 Tax=Selaginella moellendorffii TaxID=88036 RepID=UPI000D1CD9CE|nr:uncharacterized protein LOC112350152 [Selaginella moellendorffii]|eukprot:XP_024541616.1 uncharacterized protein LOC112350152 [Selaginella moellendorffii]
MAAERRTPKPAEVIAYYKSKGLNQEQACEKAVESLQKALALSLRRQQIQPERIALLESQVVNVGQAVRDLDKKLSRLEMALDSKPGIAQIFAAGVASGSAIRGLFDGAPHLFRAIAQVSGNISSSMRHKSSRL